MGSAALSFLLIAAALLLWAFRPRAEGLAGPASPEIEALARVGRELFARGTPSYALFAKKAGEASEAAGVSAVAAFYGLRAMSQRGGITPRRVATLARP